MAPTQIEEQVRALVEGIVTGAGAELDAVAILKQNGALVCRITVEEPLGSEKLSSDALADISRAISKAMDAADPISDAYMLEVSTPGAERPLTDPRHFSRAEGRLVALTLADGSGLDGRLQNLDGDTVSVRANGRLHTVRIAEISSGRMRVDMGKAESKAVEEGKD